MTKNYSFNILLCFSLLCSSLLASVIKCEVTRYPINKNVKRGFDQVEPSQPTARNVKAKRQQESTPGTAVVDPQEELVKAIRGNQLDVVWRLVESGKCSLLDQNLVWRLMKDNNITTTLTIIEGIVDGVEKLIKEPQICQAVIKEAFIQLLRHLSNAASADSTAKLLAKLIEAHPELEALALQYGFVYGRISKLSVRLSSYKLVQGDALPPLKHVSPYFTKKLIPGTEVYDLLLKKYSKEQIWREIIYFLPATTIHRLVDIESGRDIYKEGSIVDEEGEKKLALLMDENSFVFYKLFTMEFPRLNPAKWKSLTRPVALEERFWFNCLCDNMAGLMTPTEGHLGSVIIDEKDHSIQKMLFPHYNRFYLQHANRIRARVRFESEKEKDRLNLFYQHLRDLEESGRRFLEPEKYNDIVCEKIRGLEKGASYALDIYLREPASQGQGHLVIGIVSVVEGKGYCLRLINSGWGSPRMEGFCARFVLYTDFEGIGLEQIINRYILRQSTLEDLDPKCFKKVIRSHSYSASGRGQREGTCSLERIAAMGKLDLTPPDSYDLGLYMEWKTAFRLAFLETLRGRFDQLVQQSWDSERSSFWCIPHSTTVMETDLLKQLERLPSGPRKSRLIDLVNDSARKLLQ